MFKVGLLSLLIWPRSLVISRLDTKSGHEAQQTAGPQVHRSTPEERSDICCCILSDLTTSMESSSVYLYYGSDSGH
jgi:hypothetical protein